MDILDAVNGVKNFFDGEYYSLTNTAALTEIETEDMQRQTECDPFDHCYVDQGDGGMSGDDFHGIVYFHVGDEKYLVADY